MKQLKISFIMLLTMTIILGIAYPIMMTGIARIIFQEKSGGNLIYINNKIIGSKLIGQSFTGAKYFHGRPSSNYYDAVSSGGSNYGPTNKKFIEQVSERAEHLRKENKLVPSTIIPADTVLASGSGLDPHINLDSAMLQVKRIANERKINESIIIDLVNSKAEKQYFGIAGGYFVNVVELNMALECIPVGYKPVIPESEASRESRFYQKNGFPHSRE